VILHNGDLSPLPDKMRIVSKILALPDPPKTRLYIGLPPKLDPNPAARQMMEPPDVLVIEQDENGFFLYRFTAAGVFAGDTWHLNLEDAKHQANFEFDGLITPWIPVPSDVKDVVRYALNRPS
jgi:hypothetical protein